MENWKSLVTAQDLIDDSEMMINALENQRVKEIQEGLR